MDSAYPDHSASEKAEAHPSHLAIEVDCGLPFVIDENTDVEREVKAAMRECVEMLKSYAYRIAIVVILLVGVLYLQGVLMFLSDTYYLKTNRVPLLDRVHEVLDKFKHPFTPVLCDTMMHIFVGAGVLRIVLFSPLFYLLQMALRYIALFGTGYFIRGFFVYATTMPSCIHNCEPDLKIRGFFQFTVRIMAGYMGLVTNCTDLIISGHTIFTVLTCILFVENVKYLATKLVLVAYAAFVLFLIVACKYHYTVDILFGLIIAVLLHYYYYSKVDAVGVYTVNRIYNGNSRAFNELRKTKAHTSFLARTLVRMEMLEERLVLGQKLRALYLLVDSQKELLDPKLRRKFRNMARLFGADETDDLVALYRGTREFNFFYWKCIYRTLFKRKKNVVYL